MSDCAVLLAALLMYAKHPMTHNSPGWVGFAVPEDFIPEAEKALSAALASTEGGA